MNRQLIDEAVRLFGAINTQIVALDRRRDRRGAFTDPSDRAAWQRLERLRRRAFARWCRRGGPSLEPQL